MPPKSTTSATWPCPLLPPNRDELDAFETLAETGRIVWDRLDWERSVEDLIGELAAEYGTPPDEIETDVAGLMTELLKRSIVVPQNGQ